MISMAWVLSAGLIGFSVYGLLRALAWRNEQLDDLSQWTQAELDDFLFAPERRKR